MFRKLKGMIRLASWDQIPQAKRTQRRNTFNSMTQSDATSDIRRRLHEHASFASKNSASCINERTTESFLVIPFIRFLGYNPHDPDEVHPQFDTAPEGGEKAPVDFAIFSELKGEPKPFVLVEAKAFNRTIGQDEVDQLKGYVGATTATFGLLTDGNVCHWYKRPPGKNFMDDRPFLTHSILNPSDNEIEWLSAVSNGAMERGDMERLAWRMSLENEIRKWLLLTFAAPGDPAAINKAANLGVPKREHEVVLEAAKSVWASFRSESQLPPPLPPVRPDTRHTSSGPVTAAPNIQFMSNLENRLDIGSGETLDRGKHRRAWRVGGGDWKVEKNAIQLMGQVLGMLLGLDCRRNNERELESLHGSIRYSETDPGSTYRKIDGFSNLYFNRILGNKAKIGLLSTVADGLQLDSKEGSAFGPDPTIEVWLVEGPPKNA